MKRTDSEEYIIGSVFLLSNRLNQIGDRILPDITFKQFILLITIHKMGNVKKNMNNIAEMMGTTRQNIKKMLASLESNGYVSITKSKQDARAFDIELTEKTLRYFSENATNAAKEAHRLFRAFSDTEIDLFVKLLTNMLSSIDDCSESAHYEDSKR